MGSFFTQIEKTFLKKWMIYDEGTYKISFSMGIYPLDPKLTSVFHVSSNPCDLLALFRKNWFYGFSNNIFIGKGEEVMP